MTPSRVLLIDDDPKVLRLLEATLRLKDYDVVKMESGVEALRWLQADEPDLIISDIMMPDLDGYDFFRRVRASTRATAVPFIFLSARSEPEDVVRGLRLGADEFLRKPFSIDELLVRVERVLDRARAGGLAPGSPGAAGVFEGDLEHMPLSDVIRMLSVQRKTGLLRVDPAGVPGAGAIQFVEGQAFHAEFGALQGEAALFQLLLRERGRFSFRPGEELPGDTIEVATLPLLMEAYRLVDIGVLRRIDPHNAVAAATLTRLVAERRREVAPLPRIDEQPEPSMSLGLPGMALRLTRGRAPGGPPDPDAAGTSLDEPDLAETLQVTTDDVFSSDDLPALADLGAARGGEGPDTWERAGLIADDADDSEVGLDSIELAPGFVTSEIEALQAEIDHRPAPPASLRAAPIDPEPTGETPPIRADSTHDEPKPEPDPEHVPTEIPEPDPDATGRIMIDSGVVAVSLVEDTAYEVPVVAVESGSDRLMDLYERLKVAARQELRTRQVQLGTRSGRVIASTIADPTRRATVAAFSAQALAFAAADPSGLQFAALDAGELQVVVLEADHLRVFTLLFDRKPDPATVLDALRPVVLRWREAG